MTAARGVQAATAVRRPGPLSLPQLTGFLLRRAYVKAASSAQACIGSDTQVREVAMLALLDERGPLSQRALSDLTDVNRSIMVKLVDSFEQRGWVKRERNPDDRRSYALRLTADGYRALQGLRNDLDTGEREFTAALTDDERTQLREDLLTLLGDDGWLVIDQLARHTGFLVAQAHRLCRGWALERLEPLGLDPRDFGVLATLARDQPCTQNHLAQVLGVSPPAALSFVEELEAVGLVRRERRVDDRRAYDLRLTDLGTKRWSEAKRAAAAVQTRVVERLGPQADERLRALLAQVITTDAAMQHAPQSAKNSSPNEE
jgi:DNA-binding MarR family transcriptional regulator